MILQIRVYIRNESSLRVFQTRNRATVTSNNENSHSYCLCNYVHAVAETFGQRRWSVLLQIMVHIMMMVELLILKLHDEHGLSRYDV